MKVVLLLAAVYALIFNQASKQIDMKRVIQLRKEKKMPADDGLFINAVGSPNTVTEAGSILPAAGKHPFASPLYHFKPEAGTLEPRTLLYPINYSYPASLDKKRS